MQEMVATGNFIGHFASGAFFLFFGVLWLIKSIKISLSGRQYVASTTFPSRCPLFSPYMNVEAYVKIIFCIIGIAGEIASTVDANYNFDFGANNLQHCVMNMFFLLNGIVEVMITKDKFKTPISDKQRLPFSGDANRIFPEGTDYLTLTIAVFVEGLVFYHHTLGRSALDVRLHSLLVITIFLSFVAIMIEWSHRKHILASLFRAITFCVQGTWMMQVAFLLFNPLPGAVPWEEHNHQQLMLITTIYCIHWAIAFLFAIIIASVISVKHQNFSSNVSKKEEFEEADEIIFEVVNKFIE